MLLIELLKQLKSLSLFSNCCSRSSFSKGALGCKLSYFWSFYIAKFKQIYPSKDPFRCGKMLSNLVMLINSV